jgi:hypothetical protein
MALVEVIDPFVKRRVWPGRWVEHEGGKRSGMEPSPSSVARVADADWVAAAPGLECEGVLALLEKRETHHAMVFERGDLIGVLCSCDLIGARPLDPIYGVMSRRVITIEARASVWMAAKIMSQTGVGCLPVTEHGRVVGLVDRDRLLEAGIPLEATGPICSSCGSHRHVPLRRPSELRLCLDCSDRAAPANLEDPELDTLDLGIGD